MGEYEDYERQVEAIRRQNVAVLEDFKAWLSEKGLVEKTISQHQQNIDFYINHFLVYEMPKGPAEGIYDIGYFLGYWFIRKTTWSSVNTIKSNVASLKKFYVFLQERGQVTAEEVQELKQTIKEELPDWLDNVY